MAIYAKKYNKSLKKWEIVSPTSDNDVVVLNNNYTESGTPVTLNHTLSQISGDIEKLQRNVSWLAEHGGGGGGYGTGNTNNYGITVINGGLKDKQLYVSSNSCTVSFRITGGTATDTVQYRITYDGNYLDYNYTKVSVNTKVDVEISNIEKYSDKTPHSFIIDAIDPDGITIPSYELYIVETSIVLGVKEPNIFKIGSDDALQVFVTNKVLNSSVTITVKNTTTNKEVTKTYTSNTTKMTPPIEFKFFGVGGLVDTATVGAKYNITINAQASIGQNTFEAEEITTTVRVISSDSIVIILNDLPTEDEFDNLDSSKKKEVSSNGSLSFGFTPFYDSLVPSVYYAIQFRKVDGTTKAVVGNYDDYSQSLNFSTNIGVMRTITANLNSDFVGDKVFVDVKCWSIDGKVNGTATGVFTVNRAKTDAYETQVPIRGINNSVGNAMYASWGHNEFTNATHTPNSPYVMSSIDTYLPVGSTDDKLTSSKVIMHVNGTNGEVNGFKSEKSSASYLRLSNEAYATVDISGGTNNINTWKSNDGFAISVTFKSDYHPYNNRTIFFMGYNDDSNVFKSGLKIDLEKVYWYFDTDNGREKMEVNIQQNALTTVDFVYVHENSQYGNTGMAKIYVNGVINAVKEANSYKTTMPNTIYLGSNVSQDGKTAWNNADVNIYDLRIFNKYLDDIEVVINSHNDRAERSEDGTIDSTPYREWKKRNYLIDTDKGTSSAISKLYGTSGYVETVGYADLKENSPLPIVWLNGTKSGFEKTTFTSIPSNPTEATTIKYAGFELYYYDPKGGKNGSGKEVVTSGITVSIQGTSSTTYRSKNLELYFTKQIDPKNNPDKLEMFQPKDTWFPESEFTLKADVVDSAHANNATLGKWINEYGAKTVLEENPAMKAAKAKPPRDVDENGIDHGVQSTPEVKHTLEGFPVILIMTFAGESSPTLLGIYSFNLGRYSYFNMGFNFLKSFSRRKSVNNYEDEGTPALIDTYEPYEQGETIKYDGGQIDLSNVYSFEFGSDADDNGKEHPTWSQDDVTIIKHLGEFKYNGAVIPHNSQPPTPASETEPSPWNSLHRLFAQTARLPISSEVYSIYQYDTTSGFVKRNDATYTNNTTTVEDFVNKLSIKNAYGYFVIAMAFGMVDSLGKNMTLRTWDGEKWYPAFYDMDTALGLTNAGEESVASTAYIDSFNNIPRADGTNIMIVNRNDKFGGYGAYNSKLWNILRATSDEQGSKTTWANLCGSAGWTEGFYSEFWEKLRDYTKNEDGTTKGPLSSPDKFLSLFTDQTKDIGEMLYNADFNIKYLTKYTTDLGNYTYGNIAMLHGTRIEYIRSWLKDRFCFLDGVLNYTNLNDENPYPYYKTGQITCGGPKGGGYPTFIISTTSPTIFTANIGQNGELSKWFIRAYEDTKVILPYLSSGSKRITINSTSIITKLDGLKDNTFEKFESIELPSLSEIDLNLVETLSKDAPVDFSSTFISMIDGKRVSDIRKINLSNTSGSTNFPVTLSGQTSLGSFNYWKVNSIDINNSCVTSLALPSSPLSKLDVTNSEITSLSINNQPYLPDEAFKFNGCNSLGQLTISDCSGLKNLQINSMNVLDTLEVSQCNKIQSIEASGNTRLTAVTIYSCSELTTLNLNGCTNENLQITITNCPKLKKVILSKLSTKKPIIMPVTDDVKSIQTLDLSYSSGIDGFKFGPNGSVLQYNGENVLDLSSFSGLISGVLNMQNASSVKYVKFANDENNPFSLGSYFFNGCGSLRRVFGNIELKGVSIFNDCRHFSIRESADTEITEAKLTQFDETNDSNSGFVTNIQIGTNDLSLMFSKTSCNLYDVYYILRKCDNVTNISEMFSYVKTIEANTGSNSLKAEAFSHCGNVTNASGLFYACGFKTRIPSPKLEGEKVTSKGMFQYMPNLKYFYQTFHGCTVYVDDNLFYGEPLSIIDISYFNPIFVKDANSTEIENVAWARAGRLFKYMPHLNSIDSSFNNSRIYFTHVNTGLNVGGTDIYTTDIFYNTPNLTNVSSSFTGLTACGYIRNIFGGYGTSIDKSESGNFSSKITAVTASFSVNTISGGTVNGDNPIPDGEKNIANVYIGDSFLAKISNSIVYLGRDGTAQSDFVFYGNFSKYVDSVDLDAVDKDAMFPYKVLLNCKNLVAAPGLFYGMKRPTGYTDTILTLPYYTVGNDKVSMFKDSVKLKNFAYGFANLQIPFKLEGFGFANAKALENVAGLFQNSNLQGQVPYGLFYQEETKRYTSMSGLTYAAASKKGIDSGNYGVENLLVSGGQVIANFKDDKILTSKSDPFISDGTIYYMDDYGELCKATSGDNGTTTWYDSRDDDKKNPHTGNVRDVKNPVYSTDEAISAFTGSYKTYRRNITNMNSIFSGIKSEQLEAYRLDVSKDDLTLEKYNDPNSNICKNVIEDNPNYSPIFVMPNNNFNPQYWIHNSIDGTKTPNPRYDPRRVIGNSAYDKYPKIWNKWINDGTSTLYRAITGSTIYQNIGGPNDIGISSGLPDDISNSETTSSLDENLFPDVLTSDPDDEKPKQRQQTRKYFVAGDLFRYCKNNATIHSAFQGSGGPMLDSDHKNGWPFTIKKGFYGSIPPFFFENVKNTTSLANMFAGVRGLTPYRWAKTTSSLGDMFPPYLLKGMGLLNDIHNMFEGCYIYPYEQIPNTFFITNVRLQNLSHLFYECKFADKDASHEQLPSSLFNNCSDIQDVSYMFYREGWWSWRAPSKMSKELFTPENNPSIKHVEYFMYNANNTSGYVPDFWNWSPKISYHTKTYNGIDKNKIKNTDIPTDYTS